MKESEAYYKLLADFHYVCDHVSRIAADNGGPEFRHADTFSKSERQSEMNTVLRFIEDKLKTGPAPTLEVVDDQEAPLRREAKRLVFGGYTCCQSAAGCIEHRRDPEKPRYKLTAAQFSAFILAAAEIASMTQGERIREARLVFGKTVVDVARALDVVGSYVAAIERGTAVLTPSQWYELANCFGIDVRELNGWSFGA